MTSRRSRQGVDRRTDGDCPAEGRAVAGAHGARHLKKSDGILREGVAVRYAFVERHRGIWPIVVQCRVLQVSASGYHQHRLRQAADAGPNWPAVQPGRRLSDTALAVHIKAVFAEMKGAKPRTRSWTGLPSTITDGSIRRWAMPVPRRSNKNGLPGKLAWQHSQYVKGDATRGQGHSDRFTDANVEQLASSGVWACRVSRKCTANTSLNERPTQVRPSVPFTL